MNEAAAKRRRDAEERKRQAAAARQMQEEQLARENQRQADIRIEQDQIRKLLEEEGRVEFENANVCKVCYSNFLVDGSDETLDCGHVVCVKCYRKYLETEIRSSGKRDFLCLECDADGKKVYLSQADI